MRVVVYDVAAESGGALSILNEYYREALIDTDNQYLFIVSLSGLASSDNVSVICCPEAKKSWGHRLLFDWAKAPRMIRDFEAEEVLSLQNILVPRVAVKQTIYMHNVLPRPLCDYKFGLFEAPKMWVYQNVIGKLITYSCRKADRVIVQTKWLANRLSERCNIETERILVKSLDMKITLSPRMPRSNVFTFVYPASAEPFKNHQVIVDACRSLKLEGVDGFKIVFTLNGAENKFSEYLRRQCELEKLPIEFVGWLKKDQLDHIYTYSDCLLFPSKLESWGLPLSEAKAYSLLIIASDLEYAHETIGEYERVHYFDQDDSDQLALFMRNALLGVEKND